MKKVDKMSSNSTSKFYEMEKRMKDLLEIQISGHEPTLSISNLCSQDYYLGHYSVLGDKNYTKEKFGELLPFIKLKSPWKKDVKNMKSVSSSAR